MEGSHSEAIFESLNLNPQLFINEVLSSVDDLLDEALLFYNQQVSKILKIEGTDRAPELTKGFAYLRDVIQSVLDSHLGMWEKYCLRRCFAVPEGFSLSKNEGSVEDLVSQDELIDKELDSELDTLRAKLSVTRKESAKLNQELQTLERHSVSGNNLTQIAIEALQLYDQNSLNDMFQEMMKNAEELSLKMRELEERRMGENKRRKTFSLDIEREDFPVILGTSNAGLGNVKMEDLQKFVAALKSV